MPGLLVAMPATPADTKGLLKAALRGGDPVIFLMHKMLTGMRGEVGGPDDLVPFGKGAIVRPGRDVTVVAYSITVSKALKAADTLAREGIEVEVIDLRTIFPLDFALIAESVRRTGHVVAVGEAPRFGGIISEVAASIQEHVFDYLDAPVVRVGGQHVPIPHSPPLFESLIPQVPDIERAIRDVL
jgi:pyruvate dehydrogenase E1 component beta subunit